MCGYIALTELGMGANMARPGSLPVFPGATPFGDELDARSSNTAVLINGKGGSDTIWSGPYADEITGAGGDDYIYASPSDVLIDGGAGNDTADFSLYVADGSGWGVNARIFGGELGLWPPDDGSVPLITGTLKNVENLVGSDYDDALQGGRTVNVLDGGAGNDWLIAWASGDFLAGGAGADRFVLDNAAGTTTILDFNYAEGDRIYLAGVSGIDWTQGTGADQFGVSHDAWVGSYVDQSGNSEQVILLDVTMTPGSDWLMTNF